MTFTEDAAIRLADIHALLGNQRRWLAVGYLSLFNSGDTVEVRQLARVIRSIETQTPPTQVSTGDYESAYNSLIQAHLPRLAEHGLIDYDEHRKTATVRQCLMRYALISTLTRFLNPT